MINKDYLVKQLKSLENRVVADKNWKREQRKLLVSQLRSQTEDIVGLETEKELNIFSHFQMILKPVILLLVFVLGSGWLGVVASEQSLPGDLLYSIKISSEKAKVKLTFDKNKKAELHVELAQKRVTEIKELKKKEVEEQKVVEKEVIEETYNKVKAELNEAKVALKELKDESSQGEDQDKKEKTVELVKTVEKVDDGVKHITKDLSEILEGQGEELLTETVIGGDKIIEETLNDVENLGDDVTVMVKEMVEGSKEDISSDSEASEAVTKIIERSTSELQEKTDKMLELSPDGEALEETSLEGSENGDEPNVLEEDVLLVDEDLEAETVIAPEEMDTVTVENSELISLLDEEALAKIEALINDENMIITLEEGKELSDILNLEIINLLNSGDFDQALAHLEKSKIIVDKMEVAAKETIVDDTVEDVNVDDNHDGLSQEVEIETLEISEETEIIEDTNLIDEVEISTENQVESEINPEEVVSETN